MALKSLYKLSLTVSCLLIPYSYALSTPIQCPSGTSFKHISGEGLTWKQPYADWGKGFTWEKDAKPTRLPNDTLLDVIITIPSQYVECQYDSNDNGDIHLEWQSLNPVSTVPKDTPPHSFSPAKDLPDGYYKCQTNAYTPEQCAWSE